LICTTYPPKTRGEQWVNNSDSPVKSIALAIFTLELFTAKQPEKTGGEQVSAGIFENFLKKVQPR
jgi:hypothetical protein